MEKIDMNEMIALEAEKLISEMEDPNYEFPKVFSKTDWVLAIITIVVAGFFTIIGAWL